jgi:hypothetical protein
MDYKEKVIALLNSKELSQEQKEKLESIFPELAESEDERIRKRLIEYFEGYYDRFATDRNHINVHWEGLEVKKVLAWLEKQCENNKWKPSKYEMDALYGLAYITNKMDDKKDEAITKLYQDLKREFFSGVSYENMFPSSPVYAPIKLKKRGKQNPAWSEDSWLNDIISKAECDLQLNKDEIDWLKSIKGRIQPKQE